MPAKMMANYCGTAGTDIHQSKYNNAHSSTAVIARVPKGITLEILNGASSDFIRNAIGAFTYAQ